MLKFVAMTVISLSSVCGAFAQDAETAEVSSASVEVVSEAPSSESAAE